MTGSRAGGLHRQNGAGGAAADEEFVRRTYRSALFVTAFVALMLASYAQFWAIVPVLAGALLGLALLYSMEAFVRRLFTTDRAMAARTGAKGAGPGRIIVGLALVKYPLVALALWAVTRYWSPREVVAFTGGFTILPAVITLRGVGRLLVERLNTSEGPH